MTATMFNALNYDRVMNGLPPLTWSPKLAQRRRLVGPPDVAAPARSTTRT